MSEEYDLLDALDRLHSTPVGAERIVRNLGIGQMNPVEYCREEIKHGIITRKGKNIYAESENCVITIHAGNLSMITAHGKKKTHQKEPIG